MKKAERFYEARAPAWWAAARRAAHARELRRRRARLRLKGRRKRHFKEKAARLLSMLKRAAFVVLCALAVVGLVLSVLADGKPARGRKE
jgi:hypothetical protein